MNTLKTDYVDAVFTGNRKYTMTNNSDSTISLTDATSYTTEGTSFGASDINATNTAVNALIGSVNVNVTTGSWTASGGVFYKEFAVTGMRATDTPVVSLYIPNATAKATAKSYQKMFSYINNIETYANKIRIYVHTAPTAAFTITIKGA